MPGTSMTNRERRGRLWLGIFTAGLVVIALIRIAVNLLSLHRGLNLFGFAMPAAGLWFLWLVWTGDAWARWGSVFFFLVDGVATLAPWIFISAGAWAITPPEQAAAGRQVFLTVMLPLMAPFIASSLWKISFALWLGLSGSFQAFSNRQRFEGGTLLTALRQWREGTAEPGVNQRQIGEVHIPSGTLLISDPMYISDPVRVSGLPTGRFPVIAQIVQYPEGGQRIARISIRFRDGEPTRSALVGMVGVDSAHVIALDEQTYREHWQDVGPERVGMTHSPNDNRDVAALIAKRFGLAWRPVNGFRSMFLEPISEELEEQITDYLKTFPQYADYPFLYFRVVTNNTFDRIQEAMSEASWCELPLEADTSADDDGAAKLIAFSSGFGDGSYDLVGQYDGENLIAVEIIFIGPEQDRILEGFPFLRGTFDS